MDSFDITGRVAIITGAAQGIGRAMMEGFALAGAKVAGVDVQEEKLKELERELGQKGAGCLTFAVDIRDRAAFAGVVEQVQVQWEGVDILCNVAGVNVHKESLEMTEADWDRVMDINLKAVFFCSQAAARVMVSRKKGKIINISSTFGIVGFPQRAAYCASKGGVSVLTKALAVEWAPYGVNVNAIAPAAVFTPSRAELFSDPTFMENLLRRLPLGRLAQVDDVVNAALYLASPASDFVTGHILLVDGGWTAI